MSATINSHTMLSIKKFQNAGYKITAFIQNIKYEK